MLDFNVIACCFVVIPLDFDANIIDKHCTLTVSVSHAQILDMHTGLELKTNHLLSTNRANIKRLLAFS